MKKILLLAVAVLFAVSCESDDNNNSSNNTVSGYWVLAEILIDPGDGSGTFQPVQSTKTLFFNTEDSTITANGSLCSIIADYGITSEGTYSETNKTISVDCGDDFTTLNYEIINGELILYYPCIEACQAKYTRMLED